MFALTMLQQRRSIHGLQRTANSIPVQVIEPPLPGTRLRIWLHGPKHQVLPNHEQDRDMAGSGDNILYPQDVAVENSLGRQGKLPTHFTFSYKH